MDPISSYGWAAVATKTPELLIVVAILAVAYRLAARWIDRVAQAKTQQTAVLTEWGKASIERFLRAQEAQTLAMQGISESFQRNLQDQESTSRAIRAMSSTVDDLHALVKEIHAR